jgi:hypothetical protein
MSAPIDLKAFREAREAQTRYERERGYFGLCPKCRRTDGYLNVGRDHWFVCDAHRLRWYVGSNLFSCWRDEPDSLHAENKRMLETFAECEPIRPEVAA